MSLKAVLFDMDGVIVDTEPLHRKAYYKMFSDVNIEVSQDLYESFTGQSTINICKTLCERYSLSESAETLVRIKRKHFKYLFANDTDLSLLDGVLHLIKNLHKNGITLVLASSASMPNIDRIFNRFDLNQYFIAKLSGADLKESKPHPEIFIKAAKASGHKKENCVVIEDSTNGIAAAKAAGIFCIGYDSLHSKNQDYSKADWVVHDFSKLGYKEINAKLVLKKLDND
ncbi:HAD family hydrolase [Jejudonia soesokkakensis]|uniref:HAD family hydrolase n=1 Tax=Jejudonia soesokkakensis TaxID=1323432 RepID=A0ABW2MQ09_9FLAO